MKKVIKSRFIYSVLATLTILLLICMPCGTIGMVKSYAAEQATLEYYRYDGGYYYTKLPTTGALELSPYVETDGETTLINFIKIYDDGYKDDYTDGCNGSITILAPEGCFIELTGKISTGSVSEFLYVYDGADTNAEVLLKKTGSSKNYDYSFKDIGTIKSSSNRMTIQFVADDDNADDDNGSGIELYARLINPSKTNNIEITSSPNGYITADKQSTYEFDVVTLTANANNNYLLSDIKVTDSNDNNIKVNGNWYLGNSNNMTFVMPDSDVNVTPTFTNNYTVEGGLYINMPLTGTTNGVIPDGVKSFKIYDDGGKGNNYNKECNSSLVLTAPEGYIIELTGSVTTPKNDGYNLYTALLSVSDSDGTSMINNYCSLESGAARNIPILISSGNTMTVMFKSTGSTTYAGLDLTARLINPNEEYDVTIDEVEYGSVTADKSSAKSNEIITLTVNPDDGCILSEIIAVDENGNDIVINRGNWYSCTGTATFSMPAADINIIPVFVKQHTVNGGLYINMPKDGNTAISIPEGVSSFKVYDNGGKDGNYNNSCNGMLTLTAPQGCTLILKGSVTTEYYNSDFLSIYNGTITKDVNGNIIGEKIINSLHSNYDGEPISTGFVYGGQTITIHFYSNSTDTYDGLDLTVSVISPDFEYDIVVNNTDKGMVTSNVDIAKPNDTVTVNVNPEEGYMLSDFTITDVFGNPIKYNGGWYSGNKITFIMPNSEVFIKPEYTDEFTAEGGLYVNMPTVGTTEMVIPAGVKSFKIYDDGGLDGMYSNSCNGYLKLIAPEGYFIGLTGAMNTYEAADALSIYDGPDNTAPKLLDKCYGKNSISVNSTDGGMLMHFYTDLGEILDGLDILAEISLIVYKDPVYTVPMANTLTYTGETQELVTDNNVSAGGTMLYSLTGEEGSYTSTIPTGTNASEYDVYWMIVGDKYYNDIICDTPVRVTIAKADFSIDYLNNILSPYFKSEYDGKDKSMDIIFEPVTGISGIGDVTIKFYKDGIESPFVEAGEYIVKFDIEEGLNFKAVTNLTGDICHIKINKAKPVITAPTATSILCGYSLLSSKLSDNWTWVDDTIIPESTGVYKAEIKVDDDNYDYTEIEGYNQNTHKVMIDVSVKVNKAGTNGNLTGMYLYNSKWIYVKEGRYDRSYTGMAKNSYGVWYMKNGSLDRSYTGMYLYEGKWIYVKEGKYDTGYTGMAKNSYGVWYMKNGSLDRSYTGMYLYEDKWIYVNKGKYDTSYTGLATNKYGSWFMRNGNLDRSYTGRFIVGGKIYIIKSGKVI